MSNLRDDQEQRDPVWSLLGEARMHEPDAWFAVRTLARCRHAGLGADSRDLVFGRVWRWALGSGLGFCLALLLFTRMQHAPPVASPSANQKSVQEAFQIMATMAPDSDSSSTTASWQNSSL